MVWVMNIMLMTKDSANAIIHHVGPETSVVLSFGGVSALEMQVFRVCAWMMLIKRMPINTKQ